MATTTQHAPQSPPPMFSNNNDDDDDDSPLQLRARIRKFTASNTSRVIGATYVDGYMASTPFLRQVSERNGDVIRTDFWPMLARREDEFLASLPKHWKFRNKKVGTKLSLGPLARISRQAIDSGGGSSGSSGNTTTTTSMEVITICSSFRAFITPMLTTNSQVTPVLECSTGIMFLYVLAAMFVYGLDTITDGIDNDNDNNNDGERRQQRQFLSTTGIVYNSPMMRFFRLKVQLPVFPCQIQRQCEFVSRYPFGTYVYVRGVYIWHVANYIPELAQELEANCLSASFQGENGMVVGNGRIVGFWQNPATAAALYEAKPLDEITDALSARFMEEYTRAPRKSTLLDTFQRHAPRIKIEGIDPPSPTFPFLQVGIISAFRYVMIQ